MDLQSVHICMHFLLKAGSVSVFYDAGHQKSVTFAFSVVKIWKNGASVGI